MTNISFNPLAWAIKPLYNKALAEDELFAQKVKEKESRAEKPKSLNECADYILGEAFHWAEEHQDANGIAYSGLPDDEMVNLIKHYYDEDNITIRKVNARASFTSTSAPSGASASKKTPDAKKSNKVVKMDIPTRPKETLDCVNVPMVRPASAKDARKESKAQANAVVEQDMFAGMWDEEEPETETALVEDDDDLPLA